MQRYNATQEQAVRARNLEQALTLCHRMRSRLSDWRSGKDFGKAQPLQPHQAFNWCGVARARRGRAGGGAEHARAVIVCLDSSQGVLDQCTSAAVVLAATVAPQPVLA